jgi:Ni,Fe-hydrogenase III large subunit
MSVVTGNEGDSMDRVLIRTMEVLVSTTLVVHLAHSACAATVSGTPSTSMSTHCASMCLALYTVLACNEP